MSDKPYPGDDAIIIAIYDQFGVSMKDAERWFREAKDQRIAELDAVVNDIASQAKTDELWDIGTTLEDADIEGAYDIMIQLARSVASEDTRKEASREKA